MSAYGAIGIRKDSSFLPATTWHLKTSSSLTIHHLTLATAEAFPGLVDFLHKTFEAELELGRTYPQEILPGEEYTRALFDAYYFAGDVLIAIMGREGDQLRQDGAETSIRFADAVDGRGWGECIAGCYYVSLTDLSASGGALLYPSRLRTGLDQIERGYRNRSLIMLRRIVAELDAAGETQLSGRSSHICNAGFLVPLAQRGRGIGAVLARSFLHYGPRLGYEASVFNLVYVNNIASVKLWEALNFEKAGRIPRAGRLKKADGSGEEYVDAWVFYRRFDSPAPAV